MSPESIQLRTVFRALAFAAERHRDQRRKGDDQAPYVNHLITVTEILVDIGGVTDPDVLVAAVLHDTLEDTVTEPDEIEARFGDRVRSIVEEVTDDTTLEKQERKRLQIEHSSSISTQAKLIKLADKISNVSDVTNVPPDGWSDERRMQYVDWSEQVVAGLRGCNAALEAEFDAVAAKARRAISG